MRSHLSLTIPNCEGHRSMTFPQFHLTVSNYRRTCGVCTRSCFYQRCCQVRAVRESSYGNDCCSPSLVCTHSATCAAEPTTPNITRRQFGPALTGPVVVGVNETISIWCSANATVMFMGRMELRGLFWRYSNGTRVPVVDRREPSDLGVYAERYAGIAGAGTKNWRRVLHFTTAQPSAGNYTCVAMYNQTLRNQSVEVRVTGG